jgi:hypothetical protein
MNWPKSLPPQVTLREPLVLNALVMLDIGQLHDGLMLVLNVYHLNAVRGPITIDPPGLGLDHGFQ